MIPTESILDFLRKAGRLKDTLRSAHTARGRTESVAEHSWRLALFAMLCEPGRDDLDWLTVFKLCLIHDLGEALHGDIPAVQQNPAAPKSEAEREDLQTILAALPPDAGERLLSLWDDYDQARTPEARLVKALDKLETLLQHTEGQNPPDFDYAFNLDYGRASTNLDAQTRCLRDSLDNLTRSRMLRKH